MTSVKQINWGSYSVFEGPYYFGKKKIQLPSPHDFSDEAMYVMSQTEGGVESVGMYDMGICSIGTIQWIDAASQHSVVSLIGYVMENHSNPATVTAALKPALDASNAVLVKTPAGAWRWRFDDGRIVTTQAMQRELYFKGSSGKIGEWSVEQKAHARVWAAALSSVFDDDEAVSLQARYTKPRMMGFVTTYAKNILFADTSIESSEPISLALKNAYVSYAGNNPLRATNSLKAALAATSESKWSRGWIADVLKSLVYASGVKIYPERYNKIRPVLDALYGVTLPTLIELQNRVIYRNASGGVFKSIDDVQAVLEKLGYDPGKIDGVFGSLTREALKKFQVDNGLIASGSIDDASTIALLAKLSTQEDEPVASVVEPIAPKKDDVIVPIDAGSVKPVVGSQVHDDRKNSVLQIIIDMIMQIVRLLTTRSK